MKSVAVHWQPDISRFRILLLAFIALLAGTLLTSCGSSSITSGPPPLSGNTAVTFLLTSAANDQLSQFGIQFNSITLTSQSGKTVTLNPNQTAEFIHLNGRSEPLLTVTVPQDVYVSATAGLGWANYTCETIIPSTGGPDISEYGYGQVPASKVTLNVPTPITVTGTAMGISMELLVSPSAAFPSSCYFDGTPTYSINPTFNLSAVSFSPQFAEPFLDGQISSINTAGNSFTVVLPQGQTFSVNVNNNTVYEGISGFSMFSQGMLVDMDAAIQADGSQLATRIYVADTNLTNLTVLTGPTQAINAVEPIFTSYNNQQQGYLVTSMQNDEFDYFTFGAATFSASGHYTNLLDLPFAAVFSPSTIFAGQNIYVTTHTTTTVSYPPVSSVTLIPQTINGTINGVSSQGNFTVYNVTLPAYDLIPTFAVQQGQTTVLTNPSEIVVYAGANTRLLSTQPIAVGGVARFTGLVFNDNGTVRMDCGQVNDGIAIQPTSSSTAAVRPSLLPRQRIQVQRHLQYPNESKE
jgi:hypothetical protein